jgi:hypothetical protein
MSAYRDQKKFLEELRRFERNFTSKELEDFKIFVKMDKDEEEFDTVSLSKLKTLYEKYYVNRVKKNYDQFFKKPDDSSPKS